MNPARRLSILAVLLPVAAFSGDRPDFVPHQPELFDYPNGQALAWADYDRDGDLDLVVGFQGRPLALFANTDGRFEDVAAELDILQMPVDTRSLSWGDFNNDGWPDLFVGFGRDAGVRSMLFENREGRFAEVSAQYGVDVPGTHRQASWIDYDNDGDSDLFVAMRDRASRLLRNDGDRFTDVSSEVGLNDPRRTVGAVWFDFDHDGDLDVFLANQSGDTDAMYRNDDGRFTDLASELGMNRLPSLAGRDLAEGSVGATLCDINRDGWLDLFVPTYGQDVFYVADGEGGFDERSVELGVDQRDLAVGADCGDLNNDGREDLYNISYRSGETHGYDAFYWNTGNGFDRDFPDSLARFDGDHGVRFADFDGDGDLDIALTNRRPGGRLSVLRNELPADQGAYLFVSVLDGRGNHTRQGSEVRLFDHETGRLLGTRIVDTGGGYISQNLAPIHFGTGAHRLVDIEVTSMSAEGRRIIRVTDIDVADFEGRAVKVRLETGAP